MAKTNPTFWKEATVYQIYPWSYLSTKGAPSGDLQGIRQKLSYIKSLGVDIIWLCPIYASPLKDQGYDISDYQAIHPSLGSMDDWDELCSETHKLGMKLVMDLVVNHTSDEHEWFKESRDGGPNGPKRDWYYWRQGKEGKEPFNWGAIFGGSAWELDKKSDEYYLHVFDVSQPDLNWTNPDVRKAVWDVMKFWLDKGCDGFRMDVINAISKTFEDVPVSNKDSPYQFGLLNRANGPELGAYLDEMHREVLDHYPNAFTVGEMPTVDTPEKAIHHVRHGKPLQMIFNFEHVYVDIQPGMPCFNLRDWKLTELKQILGSWASYMQDNDGWESLYLENHDQPRIISRWASDEPEFRVQSGKMLALFHATGRGTLFVYQGQEIGMANPQWKFEELRDVEEINWYNETGDALPHDEKMRRIRHSGRDNARTPMQWSSDVNAGFTKDGVTPWIKVMEDHKEWNVKAQENKEGSVLEFWKKMIKLRGEHKEILVYGRVELVDKPNEQIYAYTRSNGTEKWLIACSFTNKDVSWKSPIELKELVLSSYEDGAQGEKGHEIKLRPYEARIYKA